MKPADLGPAALHLPRNQGVQQPAANTTQNAPAAETTESAVEVSLSEDAKAFLHGGPSAHSTAGRAREALGPTEGLQALPFGKIVSALARGIDPASLIAPTTETGETLPEDGEPVVESLIFEEPVPGEETPDEPAVGETPLSDPAPIVLDEGIALALLEQIGSEEEEPLL